MGNCLKCGSVTKEKAVFCDNCLAVMDEYPVKPGTIVHIQPRPQRPERKAPESYRERAEKAQITSMRKLIRWLVVMTVLLTVLLLTSTGLLLQTMENEPEKPAIGRNYTTTHQTTPQP